MTKRSGEASGRPVKASVENEETLFKFEPEGPADPGGEALQAPPSAAARYELRDRIGGGGMGVVSSAFDRQLRREVAVKVLRPELAGDTVVRAQFTEEAVVLASLDHPGAVPVYETGTLEDGSPFCAMKKVRGATLRDILFQRGAESVASREDLAHLVDVFERVCQTVAAAHARGIVHRDLKPDNVMVDELGAVFVMDWGLAYSVHPAEAGAHVSAPAPGEIAGTPGYMAPEQARGRADQIGPHSDVFALGTILYEILTGKSPFREGTAQEALKAVQEVEPPPAVRVNPRAGRALSAVCRKAMSKEPGLRYPTARELAEEIRRYREFRPVAAAPPTAVERIANWARRRPAVAASLVTLLAALLLVGTARGYRAWSEQQLVERALERVEAAAAEVLAIDGTLADARRAAVSAPSGPDGDALRARVAPLEELRSARKEQLRTYALAVVVFTLERPDPRARAIYRLELRDAIAEALTGGQPTRAAAMAEEAIAETGRRNVPGWTAADVKWFEARLEEARALERLR
ncbi:MAG: serine/threonine protein kinase [Thermoanaerobaculia bacterium]|nr:serine/threonine protein kinase [Thermoanaerobaculia bacterium]